MEYDKAENRRAYHRAYMRRWRVSHPEYVKRDNEQRKVRRKKQQELREIMRIIKEKRHEAEIQEEIARLLYARN